MDQNDEEKQTSKVDELYTGLKITRLRSFFPSAWVTRRILFALILAFLQDRSYFVLIGIILGIQVIYLAFLSAIRPY